MPKFATLRLRTIMASLLCALLLFSCQFSSPYGEEEEGEYDGPEEALRQEIEMTRELSTGRVPWQKLLVAKLATEEAKETARQLRLSALNWEERGPNADVVGVSNGNTRANGGITAGRVRALMVDSLDPAKKTVFAGSVSGGLWKTTDITASPAVWTIVNDFMSNLAIAAICQDPRPGFQQTMYLCTGESYFNADAAQGVGVFKSTDGGATWNFLQSTSAYTFGTRILCDYLGNVYLATRSGLFRSTNGGTSWTNITPSTAASTAICDMEITSTAAQSRLHIVTGINSAQSYRYTDDPANASTGTGWNSPAVPFAIFNNRAEIAVSGNVLYAMPANGSNQVTQIFKSTDGGVNWAATTGTPPNTASGSPFANGQAWYDLSVRINPANPNECIIGGIDCARTLDGGDTWQRISAWVGTSGQYVHADQHDIQWWDGGNKLIFACDGGVHYSADKGTTIRDRNTGFRVKQFYSVAIHPTQTNYFLAGAQDNGVHQLNSAGLGNSVEVTGGDGAFVAIDQNQPSFHFGSYVYNNFRRSVNNGASWTSINISSSTGRFINPWDYDNEANIIYANSGTGNYLRWNNPQTAAGASTADTNIVNVPAFAGQRPSAIHVSPYTSHRVFFGTGNGKVVRVDQANTATPAAADITPAGAPGGYVSCVVTGSSDNNLMVVYSNYSVQNVWVTNNGGTTWTALDDIAGTNLPNMPVRWALFHPDSDTKAFIATETGVWETELFNGTSTVWEASPGMPNVRVTMLKYRSSDRTLVASTYGRGVWTSTVPLPSGFTFSTPSAAVVDCPAPQNMTITLGTTATGGFNGPISLSASGNPPGTTVSFTTNPVTPGQSTIVVLNGANSIAPGTYNVTVQGTATGATTQTRQLTFTINTGPAPVINSQPQSQSVCTGSSVSFSVGASNVNYQWQVSTNGGSTYTNISGAVSSSYAIVSAAVTLSGNLYRCVLTNDCGATATTNAALLSVSGVTAVTASPQDLSVCEGSSATFQVTAAGASLTYQWQRSTDGGSSWSAIAGATASQYIISNVTTSLNGSRYRCVVNGTCTPGTATSAAAVLSVVVPASITAQPLSQVVCDGAAVSFSTAASGPDLIYQWQVNTGSGFVNIASAGIYSGATSATLGISSATPAMSGYQYRCLVSNAVCTTAAITTSATLTVNTLPLISVSPVSQTICTGSTLSFSVTASGTGIGYQWQVNTGAGFANINNGGIYSGATTATLTLTGVTVPLSGSQYRCVVTGTCAPAAISGLATLTVHAPAVIERSAPSVEICAGGNASFTITAVSGPPISYQWQVSTNGGTTWSNIAGATSTSFTLSGVIAAMSGNRYRCQVWNSTCTTPVISNASLLTVRVVPGIGLAAAPLTSLLPGQQTTLTATPSATTGGVITTQWTYNGQVVTPLNNTYTATVNGLGDYQASIRETWPSGLFCSAISQVVTITANVSSRLFIYPSPNDGNFTVSYYNTGGGNTSRQLVIYDAKGAVIFKRGFPISGPYTLLPVDLSAAARGIYFVVVGDAAGNKLIEGKVHVR
jgi:hypothetical protein